MSNEQALLNCTFGWGQTCRLYYDSIEIAGKAYDLKDLTSIQPSYRTVLGVPSARLELSFGLDHLVLRGIADQDIARLMVSHLQPYCSTTPHTACRRARSRHARNLARAQARAWERTNKLPAILDSPRDTPAFARSAASSAHDEATASTSSFTEEPPTDEHISLAAVPKAPVEDTSLTPGETLEAFAQLASNLSTYASPLPTAFWQPPHTPRFQPPLHSVHLIPPHQKFDSSSIPVPAVKSSVLPIIHVPVRLQHGECAHYSIGAILCSDRISNSARATYPPLDNGLLILTNRRVLYIGKRCQFTLAYTHLWYVSLLHTAVALHIEGQFRRVIVELEHPHEWASRIELLAFIARRSRPEPPTLAMTAIPGLNTTVKRRAVKPASAKKRTLADNPTVPLLAERVESKIVEAETIEFSDPAILACAARETLDFPAPAPAGELPGLEKGNTPRIADQPTKTDLTIRETAPQSQMENAPTQEFPRQPDVAALATQEFSASQSQAAPAQSDLAHMITQEFVPPSQVERNSASDTAGQPEGREKMTQGLQLEQAEIARLQAAQPPDQEPEITTSALYDPALPLAALARNGGPAEEGHQPSTQELDDDDDRTIQLHDRKLCQLRTISLHDSVPGKLREPVSGRRREPISDRLPDNNEIKDRRTRRVHAPQWPS